MECLQSSIGLTKSNCKCYFKDWQEKSYCEGDGVFVDGTLYVAVNDIDSTDFDAELEAGQWVVCDYNTSASGYYIDDRSILSKIVSSCGGDFWKELKDAKEHAINSVKCDLLACAGTRAKLKSQFNGEIGGRKWIENGNSKTFSGIAICPKQGCQKITSISVLMPEKKQVTVKVFEVGCWDDPLYELEISTSNKREQVLVDWDLEDGCKYVIVYKSDGCLVRKNSLYCLTGCGKGVYKGDKSYKSWFESEGFTVDSMDDISNSCKSNGCPSCCDETYNYGLSITVKSICKASEIICKDEPDYEDSVNALIIAKMVAIKAQLYILERKRNMDITGLCKEDFTDEIKDLASVYNDRFKYVCGEMELNECYECSGMMKVANILRT